MNKAKTATLSLRFLVKAMSIEDLATHFGYSKYHFSREFKKRVGVTPNEYWAALRMEEMYLALKEGDSVLHSHLKLGYLSSGTFSNTFLESTGMTPSEYRKNLELFYKTMHLYEHTNKHTYYHYSFDQRDYRTLQEYVLRVHVEAPEDFVGTIFVGLFNKPISNHIPMVGKAMLRSRDTIIDRIPDGKYYVLAVAIPEKSSPIAYFHLDNALRAIERESVVFPLEADRNMVLTLREKTEDDPAITISPVKLLINAIKNGNLE